MRFPPGSHDNLLDHLDVRDQKNMLSRGQTMLSSIVANFCFFMLIWRTHPNKIVQKTIGVASFFGMLQVMSFRLSRERTVPDFSRMSQFRT